MSPTIAFGLFILVFAAGAWVWTDAPSYDMTRAWGIGTFFLVVPFLPLYLILRAGRERTINPDMPDPEVLANGDILVPIPAQDGTSTMARLSPGDSEHAAWLMHLQTQGRRRRGLSGGAKVGIALLVVIAALAWNAGAFDHALVNVGLNRHPCVRNGLGATFCGDEAKTYCQNTAALRRLAQPANDGCDQILQP